MGKPAIIATLVIVSAVLIAAGYFLIPFFARTTVCPLPDYMSYSGRAEELLILEGSCVVPSAIEAIRDQSLPKRPFVIAFLGNGEYKDALVPLKMIVEDETDPDRGPALIAIFHIDSNEGRQLATKYKGKEGDLGKLSLDILIDKDYLHHRTTYWQAWLNYISLVYDL